MTSQAKITGGLLGPAPTTVQLYNEKLEKLMAESLLLSLQIREPKPSIWAGAFEAEQISFERGLIAFALNERISFFETHWRGRTVEAAAKTYILSEMKKRSRGRPPKKLKRVGLLGVPLDATPELDLVNALRARAVKLGKTSSDAQIIKSIFLKLEPDGKFPTSAQGKEVFETRCRVYANKVSQQRTKKGLSRRPKKSH